MDYSTDISDTSALATRNQFSFRRGRYRQAVAGRVEVAQGWPRPRLWVWQRDANKVPEQAFSADALLDMPAMMHEAARVACSKHFAILDDESNAEADSSAERFQKLKALTRLGKTFPPEVMQRVTRFPQGRWALLCAQAWVPGFDELLVSNPVLAWALCHHRAFRSEAPANSQRHHRIMKAMVRKRQRDILQWLGFEGTESMRKLFLRIEPEASQTPLLLGLRAALQDPSVAQVLRHQRQVTAELLAVLREPVLRQYLSPRLVTTIGSVTSGPGSPELCSRLLRFLKHRSGLPPDRATERRLVYLCRSEAETHLNQLEALELEFPIPPYAGDEEIIPLRTPQELLDEAREMEHCAAMYASSVAEGDRYVYAVHAPVRGTLCLRKVDGVWLPQEVSGKQNYPFNLEIAYAVWGRLWNTTYQDGIRTLGVSDEDTDDQLLADLAGEQEWCEDDENSSPVFTRSNTETRLLGWLLLDGRQSSDVLDKVAPKDFLDLANARIFRVIKMLSIQGRDIGVEAVHDALGVATGGGFNLDWLQYLNDLVNHTPPKHNAVHYARIVRARDRELRELERAVPT